MSVISHKYKTIFIKSKKVAGTSIIEHIKKYKGKNDIFLYKGKGWHHVPAFKIKSMFNKKNWNSYYKWTVERNPFEKVVSHYHKRNEVDWNNSLTLGQWMEKSNKWKFPYSYHLYTINDEFVLDDIIFFSQLEEVGKIFEKLGIPYNGEIEGDINVGYWKDNKNYREYFENENKKYTKWIKKYYKPEFKLWGWEF